MDRGGLGGELLGADRGERGVEDDDGSVAAGRLRDVDPAVEDVEVDRDVEPVKLGQKARGRVEAIHPGARELRDPEFSIRVELNLRWVEPCDVGIEESPGGLRSGSWLVTDDAVIAEIGHPEG